MRAFGRLSMALATGLLAGAVLGAPVAAQDASPSGSSPEGTVRIFLDGLRDRDLETLMRVSAANAMAEQVDFPAYVERLQAWIPFQAPAPATDPLLIDLNRAQVLTQQLGQTRMLIYGLLTDVALDGLPVTPADAAWAEDFMRQLDLDRLAGLEVGDIVPPDPELMAGERYRDVMARQAAIHGADEMTERVATVSLDGRDWLVGFTLMRYGDVWLISSQTSAIAGLPVTGAPMPLDD